MMSSGVCMELNAQNRFSPQHPTLAIRWRELGVEGIRKQLGQWIKRPWSVCYAWSGLSMDSMDRGLLLMIT